MELPGKGLVRAYNVGADASPNAAAAPWAAFGGLGGQIQDIGEKGMGILVQAKQADTRRRASEMEMELQQTGADYQLEMLKNPNASPEDIMGGLQKRLDAVKGKYFTAGMSPDEDAVIGARFARSAASMTQETAKHAVIGSINNSKQAAINLVKQGEITGNMGMRDQGLSDLSHIAPTADIEAERMESDRRMSTSRVTLEIQANPQEWKTKLDDVTALDGYSGLGPADIPRLKEIARGAAADQSQDATNEFRDKVATHEIKEPSDIDRVFGGRVRPSVLEGMKGQLQKRYDAAAIEQRKSPEYQSELGGKASAMVGGLAKATDFEGAYADASFAIDQMEDSPLKRRLDAQLKDTKTGREAQVKSHADAAFKALDAYDARETEKLPKLGEPTSIERVLNSNFFTMDNLSGLGISDEAAKKVVEAKDKKGNVTPQSQLEAFRKLTPYWNKRGTPTASPWVQAAGEALLSGDTKVTFHSDEEEDAIISAKIDADRRSGDRRQKLAEWLEVNSEASRDEIDTKVLEISNEETARTLKSGIFDRSTSGGPKGADNSTASLPVGNDITTIIKNFEAGGEPGGFHRTAYWDVKQWSIGYGTKSKEGEVIDEKEADKRLRSELSEASSEVDTISKSVGMSFNDHEKDALTSFVFNLGGERLKQLLANGTRTKAEIANVMLQYRNAGGERLKGLENRRKAERHLFINGHKNSAPIRETAAAVMPAATDAPAAESTQNEGEFAAYNVR